MCDQSEISYGDGDVVWVKLGSLWWPGEVVGSDRVPPDVITSFKKAPIAIVKFFNEDTFEYVKNINSIYHYQCSRKSEFIKKGLAMYRSKGGNLDKFPEDIIRAETQSPDGDIEILTRDEYQEVKKQSYAGIFGDAKTPVSGKRGRAETPKRSDTPKRSPVHKIKKGNADYKATILIQESKITDEIPDNTSTSKETFDSSEVENPSTPVKPMPMTPVATPSSGMYKCHACCFSTSRLNVMILHNKSHSVSQFTHYTPSPVRKKPTPKTTTNKSLIKASSKSETDTLDLTPIESKPRKERSTKSKSSKRNADDKSTGLSAKKPKTDKEIKSSLLADWDDEWGDDKVDIAVTITSPEVCKTPKSPDAPSLDDNVNDNESVDTASTDANTSVEIVPIEKPEPSYAKFEFCEDEDWPLEADAGRKIPRVKKLTKIRTDVQAFNLDNDDNVAREVDELLQNTSVPELPSAPEFLKVEENFPKVSVVKSPDKVKPVQVTENKSPNKIEPTKTIFKTKTFFRSRHSRSQDAIEKYVAALSEQLNSTEKIDSLDCDMNGSEASPSPEPVISPPVEPVKVRLAPKIQLKMMKAEAAQLREKGIVTANYFNDQSIHKFNEITFNEQTIPISKTVVDKNVECSSANMFSGCTFSEDTKNKSGICSKELKTILDNNNRNTESRVHTDTFTEKPKDQLITVDADNLIDKSNNTGVCELNSFNNSTINDINKDKNEDIPVINYSEECNNTHVPQLSDSTQSDSENDKVTKVTSMPESLFEDDVAGEVNTEKNNAIPFTNGEKNTLIVDESYSQFKIDTQNPITENNTENTLKCDQEDLVKESNEITEVLDENITTDKFPPKSITEDIYEAVTENIKGRDMVTENNKIVEEIITENCADFSKDIAENGIITKSDAGEWTKENLVENMAVGDVTVEVAVDNVTDDYVQDDISKVIKEDSIVTENLVKDDVIEKYDQEYIAGANIIEENVPENVSRTDGVEENIATHVRQEIYPKSISDSNIIEQNIEEDFTPQNVKENITEEHVKENITEEHVIDENITEKLVIREHVRETITNEKAIQDIAEDGIVKVNTSMDHIVTDIIVQEHLDTENIVKEQIITENISEEQDILENVTEEQVITENIAEEQDITENIAEEQDITEHIVGHQVITDHIAEDQDITENIADEQVITENIVDKQVITENIAGEQVITKNIYEEQVIASDVTKDQIDIENIPENKIVTENFAWDSSIENDLKNSLLSQIGKNDSSSQVESHTFLDNAPTESDIQIAEALINLPKQPSIGFEQKLGDQITGNDCNTNDINMTTLNKASSIQLPSIDKKVINKKIATVSKTYKNATSLGRVETEEEKFENLNAAQSLVQMSEQIAETLPDTCDLQPAINEAEETVRVPAQEINTPECTKINQQNKKPLATNTNVDTTTQPISKLLQILEEPRALKKIITTPTKSLVLPKEKVISDTKNLTKSPRTCNQSVTLIQRNVSPKNVKNKVIESPQEQIVLSRSKSSLDGSKVQTYTIQGTPEASSDASSILFQQKGKIIGSPPTKVLHKINKIQSTVVGAKKEHKLLNISKDEDIFDINSMPVVLSEDIVTPENIDHMPIVMSDGNLVTNVPPPKVVKPKPMIKQIEKKLHFSKMVNKPEVKTLLINSIPEVSRVSPNILSKSSKIKGGKPMLVIDKTGRQKIIVSNPDPPIKEIKQTAKPSLLESKLAKNEKYIIVQPQSAQRTLRTQKIVIDPQTGKAHMLLSKTEPTNIPDSKPISAKLVPAASDARVGAGGRVMIITDAQGTQSKIVLTPEHEKMLFPNKQLNKPLIKTVAQRQIVNTITNVQKTSTITTIPQVTGISHTIVSKPQMKPATPKQKSAIITSKGQLIVGGRLTNPTLPSKTTMPEVKSLINTQKRIVAPEPSKVKKTPGEPLIFLQQKSGAVIQLTAEEFEHLHKTGQIVQKTMQSLPPVPPVTTIQENKIVIQKSVTIKPPNNPPVPALLKSKPRARISKMPLKSTAPTKKLRQDVITPMAPLTIHNPPAVSAISTSHSTTMHSLLIPDRSPAVAQPTTSYPDLDNFEELLPSTAIARQQDTVLQVETTVPAPEPPPIAEAQLLAVPGEHFGVSQGCFFLCIDDKGTLTPIDNRPLVLENDQLVPMAVEPVPVLAAQPERRDILEAALANSDVFHADAPQIEAPDFRDLNANVSVHCRVSETSSTLNQPIMTPVEVPSKGDTDAAVVSTIEDGLAVIGVTPHCVPTSLELPITVTDPRIAPKTTDPLSGAHFGTTMLSSSSMDMYVDSEQTIHSGPINMPLLTDEDDVIGKSMPILTDDINERAASSVESGVGSPSSLREGELEEGWSRRLLTPGSDSSETSAEIPFQPAIQLSVNDLNRNR